MSVPPSSVIRALRERVGGICSNPDCRRFTTGPQKTHKDKPIIIGQAAHICAASPGGPRHDPNMTEAQRSSIENGIWLCNNCAKLIDRDAELWLVKDEDYYGILDKDGNIILHREFDKIGINPEIFPNDSINNGVILLDNAIPVMRNGKWGLFNKKGEYILAFDYDEIGYVTAREQTSTSTGNKKTQETATIQESYKNNLLLIEDINGIIVKRGARYGVVTAKGTILIEPTYSKITTELQNGQLQYYLWNGNTSQKLEYVMQQQNQEEETTDSSETSETNITEDEVEFVNMIE